MAVSELNTIKSNNHYLSQKDLAAHQVIHPFHPLPQLECLRDYTIASGEDMIAIEAIETNVQQRIGRIFPVSGYYEVSDDDDQVCPTGCFR